MGSSIIPIYPTPRLLGGKVGIIRSLKGTPVARMYIKEQSEIFLEQEIIKLQTCHQRFLGRVSTFPHSQRRPRGWQMDTDRS